MFERVRQALGYPEAVHECRHCGEPVSATTTRCPACGTDSIARYRVE